MAPLDLSKVLLVRATFVGWFEDFEEEEDDDDDDDLTESEEAGVMKSKGVGEVFKEDDDEADEEFVAGPESGNGERDEEIVDGEVIWKGTEFSGVGKPKPANDAIKAVGDTVVRGDTGSLPGGVRPLVMGMGSALESLASLESGDPFVSSPLMSSSSSFSELSGSESKPPWPERDEKEGKSFAADTALPEAGQSSP